MKTWICIDSDNLFYRAFYGVRHSQRPLQDARYSFLLTLERLRQHLGSDDFVFCFDGRRSFRRQLFTGYKRSTVQDVARDQEKKHIAAAISRLRSELGKAGFANIFHGDGFESDDWLAAMAQHVRHTQDAAILVTSDKDLYQCLCDNVSIYRPRHQTIYTEAHFRKEYGIAPNQWVLVKSIGGCTSDKIPGIPGIGELRALQYIRGELSRTSKAFAAIRCPEGRSTVRRNRVLVELPGDGLRIDAPLRRQNWPAKHFRKLKLHT